MTVAIKKVRNFNDFDERRLCTWFDFIDNEVENVLSKLPFDKEVQEEIAEYIKKGTELQKELNEDYIGLISYNYYLKRMNYVISLQNILINEMKDYLKQYEKFIEKENKNNKKKTKKTV